MFRGAAARATPAGSRSPPKLPFRGGVSVAGSGVERASGRPTAVRTSTTDRGGAPIPNDPCHPAVLPLPLGRFSATPPATEKKTPQLGGKPRRKNTGPFLPLFPLRYCPTSKHAGMREPAYQMAPRGPDHPCCRSLMPRRARGDGRWLRLTGCLRHSAQGTLPTPGVMARALSCGLPRSISRRLPEKVWLVMFLLALTSTPPFDLVSLVSNQLLDYFRLLLQHHLLFLFSGL